MFTYWLMLCVLAIIVMFGFGVAINMVFRRWWVSLLLFALGSIWLFVKAWNHMHGALWVVYGISLLGVLLCTWAVIAMRKRGYALFM